MKTTLDRLAVGSVGKIAALNTQGATRRRLLDFGMTEDTSIRCLRRAPTGSPLIYSVRGTMLALRSQDCRQITVEVEDA